MTLLSSFLHQCSLSPDNIAVIDGEYQLSYQQLLQQIIRLSSHLQAKENPCRRVIIALDRGIDATIAILATLHAGACYIPLDLKNPSSRLNFIVNDADAQYIIGQGQCPDWLSKPDLWLNLNTVPETITKPAVSIHPELLAAILYTSGSTGQPKGVALSHQAMLNFSNWAADTFNINANDHIASLAPFHFDLSIFDLFSSLSRGACIHFMPAMLSMSPSRLTSWLSQQQITTWYTVPSLLSFIALKGSLTDTPLPALKRILFAGEVFPTPSLIQLCELLPDVAFYNLYGPTETNVCCYWPVDRKRLIAEQAIPIGIPACGSILSIDTETSELLVKSNNNLSGYWQQGSLKPVLTNDQNYATGDKVSLNEAGEFCYHGRLDRMLKCSGYRVEPAEIEQAILQCPEVEYCAVMGIKDSTSGQRPAAIVVLTTNSTLNDIVKPIRQLLPTYMQPSKYIVMDALPYLSNGKTDYLQLQRQMENT